MTRFFFTVILVLGFIAVNGQTNISFDTNHVQIPVTRHIWHENLDKEQKRTDKLDGKMDQFLKLTSSEDLNIQITDAIFRQTDELQQKIERLTLDNNSKIGFLRSLKELIQSYASQTRSNKAIAPYAPLLIEHFEKCMIRILNQESLLPVFEQLHYVPGELLAAVFTQNKDASAIARLVFLKKTHENPASIIPGIVAFEQEPFADSLIIVAAIRSPLDVYTYAQAPKTIQGKMIHNCKDSRVQMIVKLSTITNGTLFLPFLDDLIQQKVTIEDISRVADNELLYYKLLVKTQIGYHERLLNGDTPLLATALNDMLRRKATDAFVNVMNELHDEPEAVRFKVAAPLTSQEIYYLIVTTEDYIYTSTYTNLYKRMLERFPSRRSDSLLMTVRFDRFKKFIKMAANYNRLDDFLKAMPELHSLQLMYAFVNGLQRTNTLEDAVDVADSYGSINDSSLLKFIKYEVARNLERSQKIQDRRGYTIYNILHYLFKSASDTSVNLSVALGIPPVYQIDYQALADDSGRVVQHAFFYGDEDGIISFRNFMGMFNNRPEWKVVTGKEWVTITSVKGKPYTIYANLPLDNKTDLDQMAQEHLLNYLVDNNIRPTFVVHRGHSYHLKYTIQQMLPSSRIVMLGSCGGYQNLSKILNVNDDAHIISTKQVGSYSVNEPILRVLNETIRSGNNIQWIPVWQQVANSVKSDPKGSELLKDYVPPHKNLGALFIKAYRKANGQL
ncbi:MAG: hypothetical protein ACOVP6_07755 [Lacibacter sp.]